MQGVVSSVIPKERNGKKYWRVEVITPQQKRYWFSMFEEPDFAPGDEIDFFHYGGRLIRINPSWQGERRIAKAITLLVASSYAEDEEELLALAERLWRFVDGDR
jgi:hypothetical protein